MNASAIISIVLVPQQSHPLVPCCSPVYSLPRRRHFSLCLHLLTVASLCDSLVLIVIVIVIVIVSPDEKHCILTSVEMWCIKTMSTGIHDITSLSLALSYHSLISFFSLLIYLCCRDRALSIFFSPSHFFSSAILSRQISETINSCRGKIRKE